MKKEEEKNGTMGREKRRRKRDKVERKMMIEEWREKGRRRK